MGLYVTEFMDFIAARELVSLAISSAVRLVFVFVFSIILVLPWGQAVRGGGQRGMFLDGAGFLLFCTPKSPSTMPPPLCVCPRAPVSFYALHDFISACIKPFLILLPALHKTVAATAVYQLRRGAGGEEKEERKKEESLIALLYSTLL